MLQNCYIKIEEVNVGYQYFSIIMPAHNEEKCIERTLKNMLLIDYPKSKFEIIVVENGSTDKTFEKIEKIKSDSITGYNIKKKGISSAKNYGASKSAKIGNWLIFLDADSWLEKDSLNSINDYLNNHAQKPLAIGTTKVKPIEKGIMNKIWFWYFDINHRIGYSASVQIVNRRLFNKVGYDEGLKLYEDIVLIRRMQKFGKFFYISDAVVYSSARRIEKWGALKCLVTWFSMEFLPYNLKKKRDYEVVR